jgi:hypothetical protein
MIARKRGDWLVARVDGALVMMSAERGHYVELSEVGARIWDMIETPRDLDHICSQLQNEYDVTPAVCHAEVEDFLNELVKHGAIERNPPAAR